MIKNMKISKIINLDIELCYNFITYIFHLCESNNCILLIVE